MNCTINLFNFIIYLIKNITVMIQINCNPSYRAALLLNFTSTT
jgi:hypothetical protein